MNRRQVIFFLLIALVLWGSQTTLAQFTQQHKDAVIERLHYNSLIPGRNVCVRTTPPAPGTGFLCLYEEHLTQEINDLLREAYIFGRICSFYWSSTDQSGHAMLDIVECCAAAPC
jgi:hypothetical protein